MNVKNYNGNPIKCDCGKMVAVERDGKVFVMCRNCKREIDVNEKLKQKQKNTSKI